MDVDSVEHDLDFFEITNSIARVVRLTISVI